MNILITGGCGFLGTNLTAGAIARGDKVTVVDNLSRHGSSENLAWLRSQGEFSYVHADTRSANDIERVVSKSGPDAVFHVAGQVAMTTSLDDPRRDFEINALGTFNVIDAVRRYASNAVVVYSSTNKVYGDLLQYRYEEAPTRWRCIERPDGFDENTPLEFHSPYGCSKGAADQYVLDAHRMWGLKTVVFRHSSMYGGRQFSTYDQGWVGWFCRQAVVQSEASKIGREVIPFTISGDGKQVRDVLHAEDMVALYSAAVQCIDQAQGQAFNIGGGISNSLSLLELFHMLSGLVDQPLNFIRLPPRSSDQIVFVANAAKACRLLKWAPRVTSHVGIGKMIEWTKTQVAGGS